MDVEKEGSESAKDTLLRNMHQQNTSPGNQPCIEDEKASVKALGNGLYQENMETECFGNPGNPVNFSCGLQVETRASHSGLLAETGKEVGHLSPSLKNGDAHGPDPTKAPPQCPGSDMGNGSTSFNATLGQLPSPPVARRSLSRYSLKLGMDRRKSLPSPHLDIPELSKAISLELPETERMAALLLSSFQYAAQKLKCSLRQTDGFNSETFVQNVNMLSEELRFWTRKLQLDGTLQKCFEDPRASEPDPAFDASVSVLKENMVRLSEESQAWDEVLHSYQKYAEDVARQLQQCELKQGPEEPSSYLRTSQANVLQTKPDYQKILDHHGEVLYDIERVLDEINQIVKVCRVYMEDVTQYLQQLSAQLASKTSNRFTDSPARKLLRLFQTKPAPLPPPDR
nr:PREDICTED: kinetochore-associated protein DSN1 homolog isoform X1 [Anolis carolinensis]|eukprot:XP_008112647.1 PREDICTED: kinetochore-associated protein DSN1 homolog isoform X1 [Anolis carolinensis]